MHTTECVSVVGLGKLGACLAASAADKGAHVIGVDTSQKRVKQLNSGIAPVVEPGLDEMILRNRLRLSATTDMSEAVARSRITFVVVPTPSESHGGFNLEFVAQAMESIGRALAFKRTYHLVVLTSTVLPGSMENRVAPILERFSGRVCGRDFGLCYNPEFIALGSVLHDLANPDFVLIGEADSKSGDLLQEWYQSFCDHPPIVRRMNFVNAELTKISVNTFITTKIAFANTVAQLCERLPDADVDIVTGALGVDSRIGQRYLTGGLGYGGPCFPRDNQALAHVAHTLGLSAEIADATDLQNRTWAERLTNRIAEAAAPNATVGIIGLAYKPDTPVVEESQSLAIARELTSRGLRVVVFDPIANQAAHEVIGDSVVYAESVAQCLALSQVVVFANKMRELASLRAEDFPVRSHPIVVFDCWRTFRTRLENCEWVRYVPLGRGGRVESSSRRPPLEPDAPLEATLAYAETGDAVRERESSK